MIERVLLAEFRVELRTERKRQVAEVYRNDLLGRCELEYQILPVKLEGETCEHSRVQEAFRDIIHLRVGEGVTLF